MGDILEVTESRFEIWDEAAMDNLSADEELHGCGRCGEEKPAEKFSLRNRDAGDKGGHWVDISGQGRGVTCKDCILDSDTVRGNASIRLFGPSSRPNARRPHQSKWEDQTTGKKHYELALQYIIEGKPIPKRYNGIISAPDLRAADFDSPPVELDEDTTTDWGRKQKKTYRKRIEGWKPSMSTPKLQSDGVTLKNRGRIQTTITKDDPEIAAQLRYRAWELWGCCAITEWPKYEAAHIIDYRDRADQWNVFANCPDLHDAWDDGAFCVFPTGWLVTEDPIIQARFDLHKIEKALVFPEQFAFFDERVTMMGYDPWREIVARWDKDEKKNV